MLILWVALIAWPIVIAARWGVDFWMETRHAHDHPGTKEKPGRD